MGTWGIDLYDVFAYDIKDDYIETRGDTGTVLLSA